MPGLVVDGRGLVYLLGKSKPRVHLLFCSLSCYAHPDLGHAARVRTARKACRNRARRDFYAGRKNNPTSPREDRARSQRRRSDGSYPVFEGHFLRIGGQIRRVDDHRTLIRPDQS